MITSGCSVPPKRRKSMDKITERIISMAADMNDEQKKQFFKAVKEILILPELDVYLESNASATFKI